MHTTTILFNDVALIPGTAITAAGLAHIDFDDNGVWQIGAILADSSDLLRHVPLDDYPDILRMIRDGLQREYADYITMEVERAMDEGGIALRDPFAEHRLSARDLDVAA